jgi:SGNH domain (fused to AT3 domains)
MFGFGVLGHISNGLPNRSVDGLRLAQNYGLSDHCSGAGIIDTTCRTNQSPSVLVWGDSFAMHVTNSINMAVDGGVIQATLSGCPPIINYHNAPIKAGITCYDFNNKVVEYLRFTDGGRVKVVFLSTIFF